jgi:hypothetical protein
MDEKNFVDGLMETIQKRWSGAVTQRSSDRYTLGVPDVLAWMRGLHPSIGPSLGALEAIAIEAKQLHPLMPDWSHKGRRTGLMLKHPFMGPQISMLRRLLEVGVDAFGLVRVTQDTAVRIHPRDLPAKTGNFTYEELVRAGRPIHRREGLWHFWENEHDQVPGSRYRDDP